MTRTRLQNLFFPNVRKAARGCWAWTGIMVNRESNPVPVVWDGGHYVTTALRVAWRLYTGRLPHHTLRRTCGNKYCVNPTHLE